MTNDLSPQAPPDLRRERHSAVLVGHEIWVYGGRMREVSVASLSVFNPVTGQRYLLDVFLINMQVVSAVFPSLLLTAPLSRQPDVTGTVPERRYDHHCVHIPALSSLVIFSTYTLAILASVVPVIKCVRGLWMFSLLRRSSSDRAI